MRAPLLTHKSKNHGNSNWRSFSFFLVVGIFFITWVQTSRGNIFSKEHPIGVTTTTSQPIIPQPVINNPSSTRSEPVTQKIEKAKNKLNLKIKTKGPSPRGKPFIPGKPITADTIREAYTPTISAPEGQNEIECVEDDDFSHIYVEGSCTFTPGASIIPFGFSGVEFQLAPETMAKPSENWKHIHIVGKGPSRIDPKENEWPQPMWGNAFDYTVNGHTISRSSAPFYKDAMENNDHNSLIVDETVLKFLQSKGIGAVLSFNHQRLLKAEEEMFAKHDITYLHIPNGGETAISPDQLWKGATFYLDNASMGKKVTVWGWFGIGRTGEFMAAWIYEASGRNNRYSSYSQCRKETLIDKPDQWRAIEAYYEQRQHGGEDTLYPTQNYLRQIRQHGANQWWEKLESSKKQDIINFVSQAEERYGVEWGEDVKKDLIAQFGLKSSQIKVLPTILSTNNLSRPPMIRRDRTTLVHDDPFPTDLVPPPNPAPMVRQDRTTLVHDDPFPTDLVPPPNPAPMVRQETLVHDDPFPTDLVPPPHGSTDDNKF